MGVDDRHENARMIRESAEAVGSIQDLNRIRHLRFVAPGFDRPTWRTMCELGWLGLTLPDAAGGAGLGMVEFCALTEELGRRLTPEPLIEATLAVGYLPENLLPDVLAGERIVLPAWHEQENGGSVDVQTSFRNGVVHGRKQCVPMAAGADDFLVWTREGFVLVERQARGVTLKEESTQDGGQVAEIVFADSPATFVGAIPDDWMDVASLGTAAYLLGVAERAFEITLDYLRIRKQFGKAIGSFQALQHRAADLGIQLALTRASVEAAAETFDSGDRGFDRFAAVARAKSRASTTAMLVTREAIQLHGAVGYTDEHDIGLFLRKAMCLANRFGSPRQLRARYGALRPSAA